MYEVFDSFIGVDTWHTRHPLDIRRFNKALRKVVWSNEFDPEAMAEYLKNKVANHPLQSKVDRYFEDASTIKEFLKDNDIPPP
jgi:hypothetical protein